MTQIELHFFSGFSRYLNVVHGVDVPPNQQWHCNIAMVVLSTCQYSSTLLILSMTFDRFYSIIKPHKAATFNTVKRAKITIVCIVLFNVLCCIPNFFYTLSTGRVCFVFGKVRSFMITTVYRWLRNIIIPFLSLLIMNSFIIHTLRRRTSFLKSNSQGQDQNQGHGSRTKTYETQVYITLLLVTFSYLILWSPFYIYTWITNIMGYYPKTAFSVAATFLCLEISVKLGYTNYGINFLLYVISGPKFRNDLITLFSKKENVCEMSESKTTKCSSVQNIESEVS